MGMHVSVVIHRVFVRSFVRACVSHHITREKEEGSKSRRPAESSTGTTNERKQKQSKPRPRPSRRNEQTNHNQACHLHPEIHHSWVCMYPLSSCVRPFVRWFVRSCMRQSSYHKREREKEEGSKSTRPTEAPHHHHHHNRGQMQSVRTGNNRKKIIIIWEW